MIIQLELPIVTLADFDLAAWTFAPSSGFQCCELPQFLTRVAA